MIQTLVFKNIKNILICGMCCISPIIQAHRTCPMPSADVEEFSIEQFTGSWHEIVRTENPFEKGLNNVMLVFTDMDHSACPKVKMEIKGTNPSTKQEWGMNVQGNFIPAERKLKFKYMFFTYELSILYTASNDQSQVYDVALAKVVGTNYFWLFARKPYLSQKDFDQYMHIAKTHGLDTPSHKLFINPTTAQALEVLA